MIVPVPIALSEILPGVKEVLKQQGVKENHSISSKVMNLVETARRKFVDVAQPVGIKQELSTAEFADIFIGEGENDNSAPLSGIYPHADRLALFALTMGAEVSNLIAELVGSNDIALGYTLDAVASLAADNAAGLMEKQYHEAAFANQNSTIKVLGYSPGYCGWHISGQKKLFHYLKPETIGIILNDSFLMEPIKSVTGVLIAGKADIHIFKPDFSFCRVCRTHSCHSRLKSLKGERIEQWKS